MPCTQLSARIVFLYCGVRLCDAASRDEVCNDPGVLPTEQGLYDPKNEHDACGVGFIADIKGVKSHKIVLQGLEILENLTHRGAVGADPLAGDGAGLLMQIPDEFLRAEAGFELLRAGEVRRRHDLFATKRCLP